MTDQFFKRLVRDYLSSNGLEGVNVMHDCITNEILLLKFDCRMSNHFEPISDEEMRQLELTWSHRNDKVELEKVLPV